jgi:sRNA-binding protein
MKITLNSHEYDIKTDENGRTVCENSTGYLHDIIQELQLSFPRLFPEKPAEKLPLALEIDRDLDEWAKDLGIPQRDLKIALYYWCKGVRYHRAIRMGRRFNVRFSAEPWGGLAVREFDERKYD